MLEFPLELLCAQSHLFFLPLLTQAVNEKEALCKKNILNVLKLFLMKLNKKTISELLDLSLVWISGEHLKVRRAGIIALGLFFESHSANLMKYEKQVLNYNKKICTNNIKDNGSM